MSVGATTGPIARIGCTRAVAETPRTAVTLNARGALPQWHWQPDDLQQSCLSADFSGGAFACADVCDDASALCALCNGEDASCPGEDALCIGQESSLLLAAPLSCVGAGGVAIVDAYATPTCIPTASWNARRVNRRRARD